MGSLMDFAISIRVRAVVEMKQSSILLGLEGIFTGACAFYVYKKYHL